jgi:hypothetical protein
MMFFLELVIMVLTGSGVGGFFYGVLAVGGFTINIAVSDGLGFWVVCYSMVQKQSWV